LFIIQYAKPSLYNYISASNGKKMAMEQKNKNPFDIYHQFCPGCHRLIIGVYEYFDEIPAPTEKEVLD